MSATLILGLLAVSGCGGGNGRATDGGGTDVARGTGGGGARDAAIDRRVSGSGGSAAPDARPTRDSRSTGDGACGALGQPCCAPGLTCQGDPKTNVCGYLIIANDYTCIHCGGLNEPCCPSGSGCNDPSLACGRSGAQTFTCQTCGLTGNPCCGGKGGTCSASGACCDQLEGTCVAAGSTCYLEGSISSGICAASVCECGHETEPCCDYGGGNTCLDTGDLCKKSPLVSTCQQCGLPGNPCCPNNTCANGGCCVYDYASGSLCVASGATCQTSPQATCNAGSCGSCGGLGQPCCVSPENVCTSPNTFCPTQQTAATCQACGTKGQPCCAADSSFTTGTSCNSGLTCSSTSATTGGTCN